MSSRPHDSMPSSFDDDVEYQAKPMEKLMRKIKAEPLIPLGTLLTIGAFVQAMRAIRTGDHHRAQRMFRWRVGLQGLTLIAMVFGGVYLAEDRRRERDSWKEEQRQKEEERRNKWIHELEVRDAEDKAMQQALADRRERKAAAAAAAAAPADDKTAAASPVLSSLGGWFGKPRDDATAAPATSSTEEAAPAAPAATPASEEDGKSSSQLDTLGALFSKNATVAARKTSEEKK